MYAFAAHFVEVRARPDLGQVRVTRMTSRVDIGRVLNPMQARSQVLGGLVFGIGMALPEGTEYDGRNGVAAKTVAPGAIETDSGGCAMRDNPEADKLFAQMTAPGRAGLPDDIGPMIASLLSGGNRRVDAQRLEVSGGQGI